MALTISSDQPSVAEGGTLDFTVAATAGDDEKLVKHLSWVVLDASDHVAASGDFTATSGELPPITPGKAERHFAVTAAADKLYEGGGAETFTVQVRSDSAADDNKTLFKPLFWVVLDASGDVVASGDFAAASGALSPITHGKTSRDFTVTAAADKLYEGGGAETFTVQVRSDSAADDPLSGTLER